MACTIDIKANTFNIKFYTFLTKSQLKFYVSNRKLVMSHLKISVPQPCPQKWDKMTPAQGGRFCNQCDKVIVDFTKMSDDELLHYFSKNCNTEICGLFSNTQIEQKNSKLLVFFVKIRNHIEAIKFSACP